VARRAERSTWSALDEHGDSVNPLTVKYLNGLSDLLFILSRAASTDSHGGTGDILSVPGGGHGERDFPEKKKSYEPSGKSIQMHRISGGGHEGHTAGWSSRAGRGRG
jgi:hypothetical protein